ncbi:MAG: hydroxymethylpyrimidine/phosphomethylpyrimidine kinase [Pseudomonadota bacterium]|nr:hydroxymethylpyrimidine/phosphomethylpyrimidine kinase [Pseudomonadota bacterium]
MNNKPVVLCFSGHDPTGGAGIQADIEAINSHDCHATAVITALTVQDTHNVRHFECVDTQLLLRQARAVLHDMNISAIKIGMMGSVAIADAIHCLLREYPHIPVILDPILAAGGGGTLSTFHLIDAVNKLILPHTYITTPNTIEARMLAGLDDSATDEMVIKKLAATGVKYVLVTGTHADTHEVQHHLYRSTTHLQTFHYPRLPDEYHGSGCTLAASLAALIAKNTDIIHASQEALDYSYNTLTHAHALGGGQLIPNRFFWAPKK